MVRGRRYDGNSKWTGGMKRGGDGMDMGMAGGGKVCKEKGL
jgi:hypothetical protein